ncbi:hypothetical protein PACTADRAFT_2666 [Pachysolen tannophilus NRRL Y-2460]|uniref:Calnexin n=1 Tax=Pachysolen tannophilus NRRL Y-2460 TaxID=669874 RepID=A0A1E4TX53_PACTA|nr:hypothetical protein PACTADRAFT_2666 [Pachysolen tannophilus NRRL Y-2460]
MKFSSIAVPTAALLVGAMASDTTKSSVEHPEFTPYSKDELASDSFYEDFQDDGSVERWLVSHAKKDDEFTYVGKWAFEQSIVNPGFKNDKGLVLKSQAAHHAIDVQLPEVFDNTDNTLVLQYEVKLQNGLNCGGAYIKLLSAEGFPTSKDGDEFNNETPYQIMFGPDKCGMTNKVHFIIRRKNPVTGVYEEKHLRTPPMSRIVKTTSLYTLIIKPNNDFEIRINGEVAKAGNLLDEHLFSPSFNPPTEIEDPDDIKPEDWDEREQIPDPEQAEKPEDWDEDAPSKIPDPNAVKPEDWDEDELAYIPDPDAEKPEDWDDEEDGEWIAPEIPNPKCQEHGCGKWDPPLIKNPNYKGKWRQPLIPNPNYKGVWKPRTIPNPDYYEDVNASNLEAIAGLGFELWTLQEDILFDNIYLGHHIEEAEAIGNATFVPKLKIEEETSAANAPKPDFEPDLPPSLEEDANNILANVVDFVKIKSSEFIDSAVDYYYDFQAAPLNTLSSRPFEAVYYSGILLYVVFVLAGVWGALVYLFTGGSAANPAATTTTPSTTSSTTTTTNTKPKETSEEDEEIIEEKDSKATGASRRLE